MLRSLALAQDTKNCTSSLLQDPQLPGRATEGCRGTLGNAGNLLKYCLWAVPRSRTTKNHMFPSKRHKNRPKYPPEKKIARGTHHVSSRGSKPPQKYRISASESVESMSWAGPESPGSGLRRPRSQFRTELNAPPTRNGVAGGATALRGARRPFDTLYTAPPGPVDPGKFPENDCFRAGWLQLHPRRLHPHY